MDTSHLSKARPLLGRRGSQFIYKGNFTFLCADAHGPQSTPELKSISRHLFRALDHFANVLTTCDRLKWMREQCASDERFASTWMFYASTDIEYWHVQMRSLLDHLAKVIRKLACRKGQVSDSFTRLYLCVCQAKSCAHAETLVEKLGLDWFGLLTSAGWFGLLREVRETVVHWGGDTMVFGRPDDGILFQVHKGLYKNVIEGEPLMFNRNVVYFDRYAAVMLSHLLLFLEDFAATTYSRLDAEPYFNGMYVHFGLGTLMAWIDSTVLAGSAQSEGTGLGGEQTSTAHAGRKVEMIEPPGGLPGLLVGPDMPDD